MPSVEVNTGTYVKRFEFWNPSTWAVPALYWDTFSQEQRIHAICRQLSKVIAYADYLGVNVDDIAARLKAIEDGELDEFIIAAIEEWFEENQPEIMSALAAINDALPIEDFDSVNTVKSAIDSVSGEITELMEKSAFVFDNLAEALETVDETMPFVKTASYHAGGKSGGAFYRVTQEAPNGYYETAQSGVYLELLGADNVAQFGAVGDYLTDDTTAIQNAIDNLDVVNFESEKLYRVSNLVVSGNGKTLNGNNCTLKTDDYKTDVLASALGVGGTTITVTHPEYFHVNQTAFIYNEEATPTNYKVVIMGIDGNDLEIATYKPFRPAVDSQDASPYYFPAGSEIYTGTQIMTVISSMNPDGAEYHVKNVTISNFRFEQSTSFLNLEDAYWFHTSYGVVFYKTENVKFSNNYVKGASNIFLNSYSFNENVLIEENVFSDITRSHAICAHWDMVEITTTNRNHNFNVIGNTFYECPRPILYSSVEGGTCSGNNVVNSSDTTNQIGMYIYGGDIAVHNDARFQDYDQSSFYTSDIEVVNNKLKNANATGTGIFVYGARKCKVSENLVINSDRAFSVLACEQVDISNNTTDSTATGSNSASLMTYGSIKNLYFKNNVCNNARMVVIAPYQKHTGTEYWGYDDSTLFIEGNTLYENTRTAIITITGATETSHAPTKLMDIPSMLMFAGNTVITSLKDTVVLFNFSTTLVNFITDYDNLVDNQMYAYKNISYGFTLSQIGFIPHVNAEDNISMAQI